MLILQWNAERSELFNAGFPVCETVQTGTPTTVKICDITFIKPFMSCSFQWITMPGKIPRNINSFTKK